MTLADYYYNNQSPRRSSVANEFQASVIKNTFDTRDSLVTKEAVPRPMEHEKCGDSSNLEVLPLSFSQAQS